MAVNRESILKAAAGVLAQNPGATYAELAGAIGIGRATLYRYFAKRDLIIKELALFSLQEIDEAVQPLLEQDLSSHDLLYAIIEVLIPIGEVYHFLSSGNWDVWQDEDVKRVYQRQDAEFSELIQLMREEGIITSEVPVTWMVAVFDNLIYTAWMTIQDGDIARNEAANLVYRTFMKGFGI